MMFKDTLNQLLAAKDLSHDQMLAVMQQVMMGELNEAQIAALLIALRLKGETVDEIAAAATVMRQLSTKVDTKQTQYLVDTCGTGGDGIQTFNVSTVSAFVAAAAGAKVAKHGGRSVSSTCGSADLLEALGVNVNKSADEVAASVDEIGIGFMFAPNHHSAMKYAAPVRKALGVRTIFNLLGPLTNPASARRQLMGVFDQELTGKLAQVLQKLGSEHVLVVHGADGMDEISFTGDTYVAELKDDKVTEYTVNPIQFGLSLHTLKDIQIQNAAESKAMIMDVLHGKKGAARDIVLMNAGAAIYVAGLVISLEAGIQKAAQMIDEGKALATLLALQAR
ncbi:MAG: anthranilate phosphoribosyltransferase [Methylophilaceae bacterium]|nr:MAG: anthranilate phosphoribosyltransferase [Methylophilaceae bacterium]